MKIFVAPGQGSQTPGFLAPWLEDGALREIAGQLGEAAGVDLITHGTLSDADTIRDTAIAQPLIVAASLISAHAIEQATNARVGGVAGHSVGEFAAAAIAGVITEADALYLVGVRARAMAAASSEAQTGMSAVVGGSEQDVLQAIHDSGLFAANFNGAGQIVTAGAKDRLESFASNPPAGARVIPLSVAGAFHTSFMESAAASVAEAVAGVTPHVPTVTLWTNRDGSVVTDGAKFVELLVGQVTSSVRWDLCQQSFASAGVNGIIELLPAGALTGLAKRALTGVPTVSVKTPDDIAAAVELLNSNVNSLQRGIP